MNFVLKKRLNNVFVFADTKEPLHREEREGGEPELESTTTSDTNKAFSNSIIGMVWYYVLYANQRVVLICKPL